MTEWIVSSVVLIVVVAFVRQLLKGKISLQLQYALWAIVLVRLLVPVSFGESKLSVQNVVQAGQTAQTEQGEIAEPPGITIDIPPNKFEYEWVLQLAPDLAVSEPDPSLSEEKWQQQYEENWEQWQDEQDAAWEEYKAENTRHVTLSVTDVLCFVWIAGMAVTALIFAMSNLRFRLRLRRSRRVLELDCPTRVYVTGAAETPCLFGLFRPAIYLTPEVAEDEVALRHVLAHELTHYRHWDHVWSVLRCVCLAVHWYNPLVWLAASLSRRDAELACDAGTIRRIGEGERAAYGSTLIGLTCAHRSNLLHTATTMTGSKKSIKERIVLIAQKPKMAIYTLVAVILIAAVAVGCTFTGADRTGEEGKEGVEVFFVAQTETKHWEILNSVEIEGLTYDDDHDIVGAVLYRDRKNNSAGVAFVEDDSFYSLGLDAQVYAGSAFVYEGAGTVLLYLQNKAGEPYEYRVTLGFSETGVVRFHTESEVSEPPQFVQSVAQDYIEQRRAEVEQESIAVSVTHEILSEVRDLSRLELGTAGLDYAVEMWQLDYNITVAINHGQEANTTARTAYLVFLYDYINEQYTRFLGSVDDETLLSTYNTPEMIGRYGDMYRAAAMELYSQYAEASKQLHTPVAPSSGLYNLTKRGDTVSLTLHTKEGGEQRTFVLDYQSDGWKTTNLRTGVSWNLLSEAPEGDWNYWLTYTSEDGTASVTFYAGKNGPVCYRDEQRTVWWTEQGGTPAAEALREEVYDVCLSAQEASEYESISGMGLTVEADSAAQAVYQFILSYQVKQISLPEDDPWHISSYDVPEWSIYEISTDGNAVIGAFSFAFQPTGSINYFASGNLWEAKELYDDLYGDEWWVKCYEFRLERQNDGLWRCMGMGTGGYSLWGTEYRAMDMTNATEWDAAAGALNVAATLKNAMNYAVFDLNHDGQNELIIETGTYELDRIYHFFASIDGVMMEIGVESGTHSHLASDGTDLIIAAGHMGGEQAYRVTWTEGVFQSELLFDRLAGEDGYTEWPVEVKQTYHIDS